MHNDAVSEAVPGAAVTLAARAGPGHSSRAGAARLAPVLAVALVLVFALVPLWSQGAFAQSRYIVAIAYLIAAVGLNLAMGYGGELVLCHPVIMAVAGYTVGITSTLAGWPAAACVPAGILIGTLFGVVVMSPGLRVRGWYYSLITMFAVVVLKPVVTYTQDWSGGDNGLSGIPAMSFFGYPITGWALYETALGCLIVIWLLASNMMRSGWGYRLRALRDARHAAEANGIRVPQTRLAIYLLSSVPAAVAGVILAYGNAFVSAEDFGVNLMLLLLAGVALGGPGTRWGPIVGISVLVGLSFWVGPFSPYNAIILGLGLLLGTLLFPDGFIRAITERRTLPEDAEGTVRSDLPSGLSAPAAAKGVDSGTSEMVVQATAVAKRFGANVVFDDLNLQLRRGSLVGLVGPNGAGKSTFINLMTGFLRPDQGTITIDGKDVSLAHPCDIAQSGVRRTFQLPQLVDEFDVIQNIELGLIASEPSAIFGSLFRTPAQRAREARRRARALATFQMLGLPESVKDLPVAKLPLGFKRIVEVGRAIVSDPKLISLDEPAAGLNEIERDRLGTLLRRLRDMGITVLVVEHNVSFMLRYCDELVLFEMGSPALQARLGEPLPERLANYMSAAPAARRAAGGKDVA